MPPRVEPRRALRIERPDFLANYWNYQPGEHVSFFAPTQNGKTTLAFQLLDHTNTAELPSIVLVMKPRDKVVSAWAKKEPKHPIVRRWPPVLFPGQPKPPGWIVWPKATFDHEVDRAEQERVFSAVIADSFRRGNRILFLDELAGLKRLGLGAQLDDTYERAAAMGTGLWGATQRPAHVTHYAYNAATHIFIGQDRDEGNLVRYREISAVFDPREVFFNLTLLERREFLYVNSAERTMCIVGR